jgi:hypothetical protein
MQKLRDSLNSKLKKKQHQPHEGGTIQELKLDTPEPGFTQGSTPKPHVINLRKVILEKPDPKLTEQNLQH